MRANLLATLALAFVAIIFMVLVMAMPKTGVRIRVHPLLPVRHPLPEGIISAADLKSNGEVKLLTAKAAAMLVKLKQICDANHLQFVGSTYFVPTDGRIFSYSWETGLGRHVELNSPEASFQFWESSQQLAFYWNSKLEQMLDGKGFDRPDKPKWSNAQAGHVGTIFLGAIDFPVGVWLGNPITKFEPQMNLPKYLPGQWRISWRRVDDEGHPFAIDEGVMLLLVEGYGPLSIGGGLNVPYTSEKGARISQTDAIFGARKIIAAARAHPSVQSFVPTNTSIIEDKFVGGDLEIVRAQAPATSSPAAAASRQNARLAWVLIFDPVFPSTVPRPTVDHGFVVMIDAHTGEELGTDARL